jgi:ABC-type multidrug transport system fused ATPase/permease subunit
VALLFATLVVLRHVFTLLNERGTLVLKESIILDLELRLLDHLHRLPLSFLSGHHSTYLQTRVMNDARAVEGALVRTLVTVSINGLTFLVGLGFVLWVRPVLALLLVGFLVPFAFIRYHADERMRTLSAEMQERQAVASAAVSESLAGVRTIKAFVRYDLQGRIVGSRLRELRDIYIRTNWVGAVSAVGAGLVTSLCIAFVLWYGAREVLLGRMTMGEVVAVLAFLNFLYSPINTLVAANLSLQQSAAAIGRLYEFLGERPEREEGRALPAVRGRITLKGVRFRYSDGPEVLRGVDLAIEPGSTVALVGRSGAGKSTLVNLLARFHEASGGEVLLDGVDVRALSLSFLREQVGIVDQQTFLFSGTVAENVRFGRLDATDEEVREACRKAFADEFIAELPQGYATPIGERGVRLSGGQCQRLALARMFLKDPRVLILDEAVSAIDSESESAIQQALVPLARDRTTIIIAHRLSSLLLASEVVLLDGGRVVERGTHAALVEAGGMYARIFREQFRPQLGAAAVAEPPLAIA